MSIEANISKLFSSDDSKEYNEKHDFRYIMGGNTLKHHDFRNIIPGTSQYNSGNIVNILST